MYNPTENLRKQLLPTLGDVYEIFVPPYTTVAYTEPVPEDETYLVHKIRPVHENDPHWNSMGFSHEKSTVELSIEEYHSFLNRIETV